LKETLTTPETYLSAGAKRDPEEDTKDEMRRSIMLQNELDKTRAQANKIRTLEEKVKQMQDFKTQAAKAQVSESR
jgi:hypothetical protein